MPRGLVLMIEDDEWVSSLLSGAIRDAGYDVIICNTAQAGLNAACDKEPDCIICDIDLPDHDGYWVARNVRTHAITKNVHCVAGHTSSRLRRATPPRSRRIRTARRAAPPSPASRAP